MTAVISAKNAEIAAKDSIISAKALALSEKDGGLTSLQERCGSLQSQLRLTAVPAADSAEKNAGVGGHTLLPLHVLLLLMCAGMSNSPAECL